MKRTESVCDQLAEPTVRAKDGDDIAGEARAAASAGLQRAQNARLLLLRYDTTVDTLFLRIEAHLKRERVSRQTMHRAPSAPPCSSIPV